MGIIRSIFLIIIVSVLIILILPIQLLINLTNLKIKYKIPKLFLKIHKPVFFTIGILSLSLGYVGIVVPGLPTTVFILIAAWAFSKCSERFTLWLESHKIFGPIILNWQTYRGLSRRAKKLAISMIIPTFVLTIYFVFSLVGDLIFVSF